jgi:phosphomannomutase
MTPDFALKYVNAFASYLEGRPVALCRDPRASSTMLHASAVSALLSSGCEIHDLGICITPAAQFYTRTHDSVKGGIALSGGHSNADWNGIIPFRENGTCYCDYDGSEILEVFHSMDFRRMSWETMGTHANISNHEKLYLNTLLAFLDVNAISDKKLSVVVDPCNGAAAYLAVAFLQRLGCRVIPINDEPSGIFPHDPEPRPRNSHQVSSIVTAAHADIGFCLNSDGTRVAVVTNSGERVSEEYTFPLVADYCLERTPDSTVVTNISTTRTLDEVVRSHGGHVIKTPIGQSAIIAAMLNEDACLGGEGSGGVAVAGFQPAFDALVTMGMILESIALRHKSSQELITLLPRYQLVKKHIPCRPDRQYVAVEAVRNEFRNEPLVNDLDGIRVDWPDGWLHVRASATEPLIRVIAEAEERERASTRVDTVLQIIYRTI